MALPEPRPGLVVRYDYLWTREAAAGREQGKDRPACLVAASEPVMRPGYIVILPITHTAPSADTVGIEVPPRACEALGLDKARSWVIVSEYNIDEWPNAGLQQIPGRPGAFAYGFVPPGLFAQIKSRFLAVARSRPSRGVRR